MKTKRVKQAICLNCNGILQNNISPINAWFHIDSDAFKICGKSQGVPVSIHDEIKIDVFSSDMESSNLSPEL